MGVKWHLTVVLSRISPMTDDVQRLYMYFLDICISLAKTEHFCCLKSESPYLEVISLLVKNQFSVRVGVL